METCSEKTYETLGLNFEDAAPHIQSEVKSYEGYKTNNVRLSLPKKDGGYIRKKLEAWMNCCSL
jgi:hypothetical protein